MLVRRRSGAPDARRGVIGAGEVLVPRPEFTARRIRSLFAGMVTGEEDIYRNIVIRKLKE